MTEPASAERHHAHVVVHPVVSEGVARPFRRVDILGTQVGKAYGLDDVTEFCRRAGMDEFDLDAERMVEWQGGGPDVWE
ncbi:hypothetical protein [Streptacidiphilus jiangxiensis]|uniref:Uncharacterized protein n=1 Tax=Streptacidiphilus jiangxiensis TaxID=235985 RepID=A0A1H7H5L0_STRJI|nr:hypothetical protein [Streptacidiphilus jiangxiensis]SEK45581.1 hypothetical protein SAMN05414137_10286 [Streptacidiphilus jiangxiensis]